MTIELRARRFIGGCLCGALRYEAMDEPMSMGHCYCSDCQKASGSGFIPFLVFAGNAISFTGSSRSFVSTAANGSKTTRNFCPTCCSLVFGGERGQGDSFTVYAGTLDDPSVFTPAMAIFGSNRPHWVPLPATITRVFARMPRDEQGG
jgi:hypothetical protein